MQTFLISLIFIVFFNTAVTADEGKKSDIETFKEAYQTYQNNIKIGHWAAALEAARTAYKLGLKLYGPENKNTAALALNYGQIAQGEEAEKILLEAIDLYEKIYGPEAVEMIDPLVAYANASTSYEDQRGGRPYYKRALALAEQYEGENSITAGIIQLEMGRRELYVAGSPFAIKYLKRAQKIFEEAEGPEATARLAHANFWIGKYYLALNSYRNATQNLLAALATLDKISPSDRLTMTTHAFLIEAYEKRGMRDEATVHCRAIAAAEPIDPNQDYRPVYFVQPTYPAAARRSGSEGYVVISVTVDENGFVKNPEVLERNGVASLEAAALDAIQKFRYVPRFENGTTVPTDDVRYRFSFAIAD